MKNTNPGHLAAFASVSILTTLLSAGQVLADAASSPAANNDGTTASTLVVGDAGYFRVSGNKGRFQQDLGAKANAITGGINAFKYAKIIDPTSNIAVNGTAEANLGDYSFDFKYTKENWFSLSAGIKQFRTWYDGAGGAYYNGSTSVYYPASDNELFVDRRSFWIDARTNFDESKPNLALRYERNVRTGTKSSTILGSTPTGAGGKAIAPALYNLDETVDLFTADVVQNLEKFQWGAGIRVEHDNINNAVDSTGFTSLPNAAPAGSVWDNRDQSTADMFSIHAFVTGELHKKLSYGAGADFTTLDTNLGGSQIQYSGVDPVYDPTQRASISKRYDNLSGGSSLKRWTANANVSWRPTKNWTIVPSLRFQNYTTETMASWMATGATPYASTMGDDNWFDATEAIEARYTRFKSWTHTITVQALQGTGRNTQNSWNGVADPAANWTGAPARGYNDQKQTRYTEKIAYSANWYTRPGLSFAGQYYYKYDRNYSEIPYGQHTTIVNGSTPRYPGYITSQGFETHDFNIRMTWRPLTSLSSVTRYDFQVSKVYTGYGLAPQATTPAASPANPYDHPRRQSGRSSSQIISENITYTPHHRVYINANASLIFDQGSTPAVAVGTVSGATKSAVINSDNNYFNAGMNVVYVATDLDDISLDYTYYRTWNFVNNAPVGLPYGQNEKQHIVALEWARRLTAYLHFNLRYTYANYNNAGAGNLNYHANGIYGRVQYKF